MNRVGKISLAVAGVLGLLLLLISSRLFRTVLRPQPCLYGPPVTDYQEPSEKTEEPKQVIGPESE